jgi:dihydrofolate reductase
MLISLVAAIGNRRELGYSGNLLWNLPADMAHFKQITLGHMVLMGRITYLSIPPKFRPLPGRTNLILSRNPELLEPGPIACESVKFALDFAESHKESELMVIGGGEIYKELLPLANRMYITQVRQTFPLADTFFPDWHSDDWTAEKTGEHLPDEKHAFHLDFYTYSRKSLA